MQKYKAQKNYENKHLRKTISICLLSPQDNDIKQYLENLKEPISGHLKNLIRKTIDQQKS